ncbi:Alpha/Beta hydrolase protein [Rhodotorula diobovata]|uniref:Alpha/Beta hydrolase protein n=1 Tax=Rhodotorula diobovata TaxID=5288 RepID=A0A5C5FNK1_9BASI|nr:Alpha/Beta hydrolase protein [Rhodotorula diobovata]
MPFTTLADRELELFWVLNPEPTELAAATAEHPPTSQQLKPGLPVLVFLHGAGGSVLGFARQLIDPRLRERYNLCAIDCPFHGFSRSTERAEHSLEDSADWVLRVLDELELESYSIYGEGPHGANVAAWIAAKRVGQVESLVLASPGYPLEEPTVGASLQEIKEAMSANKDGKGDGTGTFPVDALEEITIYCVGADERMREARQKLGEYFQARYGTGQPGYEFAFLFSFVYERRPIPLEQLAKVACPVLILRGGADNLVCPEAAWEKWQRAFPKSSNGAQVVTVAGGFNLLSVVEGGIVNHLIARFLQRSLSDA